jgi:hypothetical protein
VAAGHGQERGEDEEEEEEEEVEGLIHFIKKIKLKFAFTD